MGNTDGTRDGTRGDGDADGGESIGRGGDEVVGRGGDEVGGRNSDDVLGRDSDGPPALSVVVVTRNERDRIETCLDSVFATCSHLPSFEVIVVDSNSTDETVERARTYPVTVLQIPDDDLCTAAAGRYVGTRHARADRILFVDGDMELVPEWLPAATRAIEDPDVAAVDGWLNEPDAETVRDVESVRGVALYDADALAAVGGFDPFLASLEDVHLGFELTAAGYRLCRLPRVAARHPARPPVIEPFRRLARGYADGLGQALRRSVGSPPVAVRHLRRMRYRFAVWLWLVMGLVAARRRSRLLAWIGLSALGALALVRRLGPLGAVTFLLDKVVVTVGVVPGLLAPDRPSAAYPLDAVEVVARRPAVGPASPAVDAGTDGDDAGERREPFPDGNGS